MFVQRSLSSNTVVFNLIIINVLAFLAAVVIGKIPGTNFYWLNTKLGMYYPAMEEFEPWQILTHFFMHGNFWHLLLNMYGLWMFGSILETRWGAKRFLIYYFICAFGAMLTFFLVGYLRGDHVSLIIGASGAVFGVLMAYGMLFPNTELLIFPLPIPIKAKYFVIGYGLIELFYGLNNMPGDTIAHTAHLGGMLIGFILVKYWQRNSDNIY